jgi:hypothetical protein
MAQMKCSHHNPRVAIQKQAQKKGFPARATPAQPVEAKYRKDEKT